MRSHNVKKTPDHNARLIRKNKLDKISVTNDTFQNSNNPISMGGTSQIGFDPIQSNNYFPAFVDKQFTS